MTGTLPPPAVRPRGAAFGLGWSAATQVAGTVVRLASTLLLTRLLAPDAYALLGTAMVVLTTLEWLSDLGVTAALVRHPKGGEAGWLLVGWRLNLHRGVGLAVAAAAAAAPLAAFYQQPDLTWVLVALAARPLLLALRSPAAPRLRRNLEYRALFVDELCQVVVGAGTSIALAWLVPGVGVWALVGGTLAGAVTGVVASYVLAPLAPRWHSDPVAGKELRRFGWGVLLNTLAMAAWLNLDRLLGLRLLPIEMVGCYVVATNLAAAVEALLTRKLDVYFGLLNRRQADERGEWHTRTSQRAMNWAGPLLCLGAFSAPFAVRLLYDARYHDAGLLLAMLLTRLIFRLAGQLDFQLLLSDGRVLPATVSYLIAGVAHAAAMFPLASFFGATGVAASVLLSTALLTTAQCLLAPTLRRGLVARLATAGGWTTAGAVAGVVGENLALGFAT
jgi:O-antigen/teichoic acid export membrane protein